MAEVKMDLAELKQLEQKIEQLEKDKKFLEDNQSQVIVHNKGYILGFEIDHKKASNINVSYTSLVESRDRYGFSTGHFEYVNHYESLSNLLKNGIIQVILRQDLTKNCKEYINLSEVTNQIKDELTLEFSDKLESEKVRANKAEVLNDTISSDYEKKIIALNKSHLEQFESLSKAHSDELKSLKEFSSLEKSTLEKEIKDIKQEFEDFKIDKKRVSLEQQLIDLQNELKEIKSKSFIKRLFNL